MFSVLLVRLLMLTSCHCWFYPGVQYELPEMTLPIFLSLKSLILLDFCKRPQWNILCNAGYGIATRVFFLGLATIVISCIAEALKDCLRRVCGWVC